MKASEALLCSQTFTSTTASLLFRALRAPGGRALALGAAAMAAAPAPAAAAASSASTSASATASGQVPPALPAFASPRRAPASLRDVATAAALFSGSALEVVGGAAAALGHQLSAAAQQAQVAAAAAAAALTPTRRAAGAAAAASSPLSSSVPPMASLAALATALPGPETALDIDLGVHVTVGAVAGLASGYAVKKVGKLALFVVGIGFVGMQLARAATAVATPAPAPAAAAAGAAAGAAATGGAKATLLPFTLPEPDYAAMEVALVRALDADGDGRVTVSDLQRRMDQLVTALGAGLPSTSAFAAAFYLGIRWG